MKLKYDFITSKVGDEIIAVAVGANADKFSGMLKLNEEGAAILELLKKDISEDELIDSLVSKYEDSTRDEISEFVKEFVSQLKEAGLLL